MSEISIRDFDVKFADGTLGLNGVDLQVEAGELVALVGPSGSGKTTLLRSLAGFTEPTRGTISIAGRDVSGLPPEDRNIGMVFQQHAVWPHMTVKENVSYPLKRRKVSRTERDERVSEVLERVGLSGFEGRKPDQLSGGQRQRVALARAIVGRPNLLLLDEAFSALDEPLRDSLRRELVALTRANALTTVHVTHDRKEALAISDRVAVLREGHIEQFGKPAEILHKPSSAWVASFMGDATLLPARIRDNRIQPDGMEISWSVEDVSLFPGVSLAPESKVELAVLPSHVEVSQLDEPAVISASVISALYESNGYSVTLGASGLTFRAFVNNQSPPVIGNQVGMKIERPFVYPA